MTKKNKQTDNRRFFLILKKGSLEKANMLFSSNMIIGRPWQQ